MPKRKFLTISALLLTFIHPVYAETIVDERCYDWPVDQHDVQLKPWFAAVSSKIKEQPTYESFSQGLVKTLKDGDRAMYHLAVRSNGEIEDWRVVYKSGSDLLDNQFLALVKDMAPFPVPPNDLPYQRGIRFEFRKKGAELELVTASRVLLTRCEAPPTNKPPLNSASIK